MMLQNNMNNLYPIPDIPDNCYVVQDEKEAVFWYKEAQRCGEKLSEEAQEFMARMNGGE